MTPLKFLENLPYLYFIDLSFIHRCLTEFYYFLSILNLHLVDWTEGGKLGERERILAENQFSSERKPGKVTKRTGTVLIQTICIQPAPYNKLTRWSIEVGPCGVGQRLFQMLVDLCDGSTLASQTHTDAYPNLHLQIHIRVLVPITISIYLYVYLCLNLFLYLNLCVNLLLYVYLYYLYL